MHQRPTYDDANLILRLYEMRRDERMRQARAWFTAKCKVKSNDELIQLAPDGSEENASVRTLRTLGTLCTGRIAQFFTDSYRDALIGPIAHLSWAAAAREETATALG